MEELLNKLIERGRKPYGIEKDDIEVCEYDKKRKRISIGYMDWESPSKGDYDWLFLDLRQLTTKESGLWQFVCEKGMAKEDKSSIELNIMSEGGVLTDKDYRFWLIESALCDEDKLEQFLLDNIKIDE